MTEKALSRSDYVNNSSNFKKKYHEENGNEVYITAKSPKYTRKKRISINQTKKYSLLSAQSKILSNKLSVPQDKCNSTNIHDHSASNDFISEESHLSYNLLAKQNNLSNNLVKRTLHPSALTLKHSNSFPSIHNKFVTNSKNFKSCDSLDCVSSTVICESQLTMEPVQILPGCSSKETDYYNVDDNLFNSKSDNVYSDIPSRRSSTSTVRERNSSLDSAFSQISISEIREAVKATKSIDEKENINNNSDWRPHHSRSKSDVSLEPHKYETEDSEVFSLPNSFNNRKEIRKRSIFEGIVFFYLFIY